MQGNAVDLLLEIEKINSDAYTAVSVLDCYTRDDKKALLNALSKVVRHSRKLARKDVFDKLKKTKNG